MSSFIPNRILALLPLFSIPIGIYVFMGGYADSDRDLRTILWIQTITLVIAITFYLLGRHYGMPRSIPIILLHLLTVLYLIPVWAFFLAFSGGSSGGWFGS